MNNIIISTIVMALMGLIFALLLSWASKKFAIETTSKIKEIVNLLPLQNCGQWGYPGCGAFAKAITDGNASQYLCPTISKENAEKIKEILAK